MAYNKNTWVNDETELSAENFNHIEDGIANAYNVPLLAVSDTAPSECSEGDKYYNTEDNLIYTATGTDTWGEDGEEPIEDILYVVFSEKNTYAYDGTQLLSVGGGSGSEIVVSPDEPTEDTKLIIDEYDLEFEGETNDIYSTDEIKTNKVWIDGKPVYRKVVSGTNLSSGNNTFQLFDDTNQRIIKMSGIIRTNQGVVFMLPDVNSLHDVQTEIYISTYTHLNINIRRDVSAIDYFAVIVEYTKTGGNS